MRYFGMKGEIDMQNVGYYNGEIGALEEMKIPMLDRAVYFGDGCYDATTFANNKIFGEKDHLDRFYNSCRLLEIPFLICQGRSWFPSFRNVLMPMIMTMVCFTGSAPVERHPVIISFRRRR